MKVCDSPVTVRLLFEPSGRAVDEIGQYYTQEKANHCVVCGSNESYIRKNIVPREYCKHFPGKPPIRLCLTFVMLFSVGPSQGCMTRFMLNGKIALCVFRFCHLSHHFIFVHLPAMSLNMLETLWLIEGHCYF